LQAFCVAAGIVLCLDVMHRSEGDSLVEVHRELIEECIARLQRLFPSAVAVQGAHILSVLLAEAKQVPRPTVITRKRGPPANSGFSDKRRRFKIMKLTSKSSDSGNATANDLNEVHAQGERLLVEGDCHTEEELKTMESRIPEMLPPQAGFSNDFLFGELLDLWL
jgi:hypothetical protein